jgi:hypothetical protein
VPMKIEPLDGDVFSAFCQCLFIRYDFRFFRLFASVYLSVTIFVFLEFAPHTY